MSPTEIESQTGFWLLGGSMAQTTRRTAARHSHDRGQIFGISSGLMALRTEQAYWLIGPGQFLWLPPFVAHDARSHGAVEGWSLYLDPARCRNLPATPFMAQGSALLNAQAERLARDTRQSPVSDRTARLAETLWDEFIALPREDTALPLPRDERLRRVTTILSSDPADRRSQTDWARLAGMSPRSFVRHFSQDTGIGFGAWRQKLRILNARERLARGERVTQVALAVGYESQGAFAAAFKALTGMSPGRYPSS
ncbi:AraC family transcriptional regulator [Asaia krungthepensis NRIC 0535]|uniref:AraC family transcriptional regulator n=2 Tax=Asaia krungthepensis TaxID=220990 RepID=A0ABQ0PZX6_9PROT|nr:AraC family transcriptional regulator [Asaia krungthepensis NRIC 0535]